MRMHAHGWRALRFRNPTGILWMLVCALALCGGCGRKLPPLPPGAPDPVEMVSAEFIGDEVIVEATCNVVEGTVLLLGKPKGICPSCTDDLVQKDEAIVDQTGLVRLKDADPDAPFMVYRLGFREGTLFWMTDACLVERE